MRRVFLVAAMLASFVCVHCVVAQEQPQPAVPQDSAPRPHIAYLDKSKIVYVTPFDASPASNEGGEQVVEPPHTAKVMADDLLHELKKLGYKTKPIGARDPRPDEGILVTGVFTQAGADGKLRLAAVGPGATGGAMQVVLTTTNLYHTAKPLYKIESKDAGGDSSGAIRLNPEVAVVKFSLPNNPADKDIKKTAEQIAAELERLTLQAEAEGPSGPNDPLNKFSKP